MTLEISTSAPEETKRLGSILAKLLKGGEVIELSSDLGGGKTTFVKGLAAGLGFDGSVPSPTFTVSRVYPVRGGLQLHHYDFYRLGAHDIVSDELDEVLKDNSAIVAIEWANQGAGSLPEDTIHIHFTPGESEDQRIVKFSGPSKIISEFKNDTNA